MEERIYCPKCKKETELKRYGIIRIKGNSYNEIICNECKTQFLIL